MALGGKREESHWVWRERGRDEKSQEKVARLARGRIRGGERERQERVVGLGSKKREDRSKRVGGPWREERRVVGFAVRGERGGEKRAKRE